MNAHSMAAEAEQAGARTPESVANKVKNALADRLEDAADLIEHRIKSIRPSTPLSDYGGKAASLLDGSAAYIRDLDPEQLNTAIRKKIKEKPGQCLLIATAAGLLLGIIIRRR